MDSMKERVESTFTGRFYTIVNRFITNDPHKLIKKNWMEIFRPRGKADFHKCAANIYHLIALSKQEVVKTIPDDSEILKEYPPIEAFIDFTFSNLSSKNEAAQKMLDKKSLRNLRFMAMGVSGVANTDKLSEFKLMSDNLSELIEGLKTKEIDPSLRRFIIKTTNDINDCLKNYKIFGIDDFDVLVYRTQNEFRQNEEMRKTIEKDNTYKKLIGLLEMAGNLNQFGATSAIEGKSVFSLNDLVENLQSMTTSQEEPEEANPAKAK